MTTDIKDTVDGVTALLTSFAKSGANSLDDVKDARDRVSGLVLNSIISPDDSTEDYISVCKGFLDNVILVKGMPTRIISGDVDISSNIVSSSGDHIAKRFDELLPLIKKRYDWCVENYRVQANIYFEEQFSNLSTLVENFLKAPPNSTKERTPRISEIRKEIRYLSKWSKLFYVYKTRSLPTEIDYIFALEGAPIAAKWIYSDLDEQGEYQVTHNHKERDNRIYAVRGNWAIRKGPVSVDLNNYIDEIDKPGQEVGCMCRLIWIHSTRELPDYMIINDNQNVAGRQKAIIETKTKSDLSSIQKKWFQKLFDR